MTISTISALFGEFPTSDIESDRLALNARWPSGCEAGTERRTGCCPIHSEARGWNPQAVHDSWGRSGRPQPVGQVKKTRSLYYSSHVRSVNRRARAAAEADLLEHVGVVRDVAPDPLIQIRTDDHAVLVDVLTLVNTCAHELLWLRRPTPYTNDVRISGLLAVPSEYGNYSVWFESQNERRVYTDVLWREQPRFLVTQPIVFTWSHAGVDIEHVVDAVVERADGSRLIVDVHGLKSDGSEDPRFLVKARLTAAWCQRVGWDYVVSGPIPAQRAYNLDHMHHYARTSARVRALAEDIQRDAGLPRSIMGIARWAAGHGHELGVAFAAVFHLVWWRQVWLDLSRPIRSHTQVRLEPVWIDDAMGWLRPVGVF